MVSKFSICSQKATPELLKSQENICNTAPSHFAPSINDWGIHILGSQFQRRKETPMLKYINTPDTMGRDQIL